MSGAAVRVEPLDPERHAGALWAASAGHDALWRHLGYGPWPDERGFRAWLGRGAASEDPLFHALVETASGEARGMAAFLRMAPEHGVIEIGHIWFAPALQRTRAATEAIFLLARRAFDELGNRRLEWKCDARNGASRRAAARYGFTYEGTFRQHMVVKGANRDSAWFALLDHEWPAARAAFEAWLDPANFDADGRQRRGLAELRTRSTAPTG